MEVLSEATEERDRMDKRMAYQSVDSLQECVLVAQNRERVEVYRRTSAQTWDQETYTTREMIHLTGVELPLPVAEIYRGVAIQLAR